MNVLFIVYLYESGTAERYHDNPDRFAKSGLHAGSFQGANYSSKCGTKFIASVLRVISESLLVQSECVILMKAVLETSPL